MFAGAKTYKSRFEFGNIHNRDLRRQGYIGSDGRNARRCLQLAQLFDESLGLL